MLAGCALTGLPSASKKKKKKNVPFTAGRTVCFLNWSRSLKRLPFGLAWNAMPFVDEFSKNFKGKIL